MSDPTRRELITWGIAAVGAAAAGAGFALATGHERAAASRPTLPTVDLPPSAWRETGGWAVGLRQPRALVLVGNALVAGGDGAVTWFAPDGAEQRRAPIDGAVLALAAGADGGVWLARSGAVERLAADGTVAWRCTLPVDSLPGGLAVTGGLVWVADCVGRRVLRFAADGSAAAGRVGCETFHIPSPWFPLAAGTDGLVWVSNTGRHRLEGYAADGRLVRQWGEAGMDAARFCGCCNPAAFQVLPDGRFVTAEKGSPRIKIHAGDGAFTELVAGPAAFHRDTVGLVVAPDGRGGLAVLDPHAKRIRIFARAT